MIDRDVPESATIEEWRATPSHRHDESVHRSSPPRRANRRIIVKEFGAIRTSTGRHQTALRAQLCVEFANTWITRTTSHSSKGGRALRASPRQPSTFTDVSHWTLVVNGRGLHSTEGERSLRSTPHSRYPSAVVTRLFDSPDDPPRPRT